MRLPRIGAGEEIDYAAAEKIIDFAYASGINYYDTAYVYNNGDSERVMGKALSRYPRDQIYMATKMPRIKCDSPETMREAFQEQLDRCQTEYFDFYLCHNLNHMTEETFTQKHVLETLIELKKEGKIRYLGFSSHGSCDMLKRFTALYAWDFAQIQLNYLDWSYQDAKGQYEFLTSQNIPIIVMEPVRGGRLASITPEMDALMHNFAPEKSIASWAIRFAAGLPNIQVVLSGMSDLAQVQDNVETMKNFAPICEEEQKILDTVTEHLLEITQIPCTGCRYCIEDCPAGLEIPALLSTYNEYRISPTFISLLPVHNAVPEKRPDQCIGCGACVTHCPQGIDIPSAMQDLTKAAIQYPLPPGR